jgi:hypothetical protein
MVFITIIYETLKNRSQTGINKNSGTDLWVNTNLSTILAVQIHHNR